MKLKGLLNKLIELFSSKQEEIELLELTDKVYHYYRKNVKGNINITEDQARRKITRNMHLAFKYKDDGTNKSYSYGCLRFTVKNGKVIWIKNWMKKHKVWEMDAKKYTELSKAYGIEDYKTL